MKTVSHPTTMKEKLMAVCQGSARKEVEREFDVLQAKWQIVPRPSRFVILARMKKVMAFCVILHNVMVEYKCREQ